MAAMASGSAPAEPPRPTLRPKQRVILHGLEAKEFNGKKGKLMFLDESLKPPRWHLTLESDPSVVHRILPEKLRPCPKEPKGKHALRPGRRVKIRGLVQQAELNGQFGRLLQLDTSVDPPRWLLRMKGQEVIYRLLPERLRLAPLPKTKRPRPPEADDAEPPDADVMGEMTEENAMAD